MGKIDQLDLTDVSKARLAQPVGTAGVIEIGGYVVVDEKQPTLTGVRKYATYEDFINEISIIAAAVRLFVNLIAKSEWQVVPAKGPDGKASPEAERIAKLVESMIDGHKTPWHRIVRKLTMYRFFGFALMEWSAIKRADGAIGVEDIRPRPQRTIARWDLDREANVLGVWQQDVTMREIYIPRSQLIYAVDDTLTENPEGVGLLRHVARAVNRLKAYEEIEGTGYENDLRGMPVAYAPLKELAEKPPEARAKAKRPMLDFIRGHIRSRKAGMLVDSETYRSNDDAQTPSSVRKWAVELMRGEGTAFEAMGATIARLNQEIARILGVEHLLIGADGVGSLALAKSKVGTFYITVISTLGELVEVIESDWLAPIAELNGWAEEDLPELQVEEVRDEDIVQVTEAISNLSTAVGGGFSPEDEFLAEIFSVMGYTPPDPELRPDPMDLMGNSGQVDPTKLPPAPNGPPPPRPRVPAAQKRWITNPAKRTKRP